MRFNPEQHHAPTPPKGVSVFERSVEIACPADEVLDFCLQGINFRKILPFRIDPAHDTDELVGRQGHVYPFDMVFGPARLRWEALVEEHSERHFTDLMLKGPMRWWRHTHRVAPIPGGCLYTDHVEYRTHLGGLTDRRVTQGLMERFFAYRHRQMKAALE